ncbi:MAG TPA: DUF192 domain-containing protein [Usitatibacteraceae bacterium]
MNAISRLRTPLFLITICAFVNAGQAKENVAAPPTINVSVNGHAVKAELATDDAARQKGLMFRTHMGKNDGMLFVFPQIAYHAMWMKNTLIPLSVAYMDEAGKIVSIHEMEPQTEISHQAEGPVRYALEMNAGWFSANKIKPGDSIKGLEKAPKGK